MVGLRIEEACKLSGVKLKPACDIAGLSYNTLYNQIKLGREIPFTSVVKLATALRIPLSFFTESSSRSGDVSTRDRWQSAEAANYERSTCTRAGFEVSTDHILDWFHQEGGLLRNWGWFADQVDLYHPLQATDSIMKPVKIGKRSLTAERLMLSGERDFMKIVSNFDRTIIDRAMRAHKDLETAPYVVTDEEIDVTIKGQRVNGGYRKVSMSLTNEEGQKFTGVFSKLTWLNSSQ
jgi:hypothetical protein